MNDGRRKKILECWSGKEIVTKPESNDAAERASGSLKRMVRCPRCGKSEWRHIPDSLADSCPCGFVRVYEGDGLFSAGTTIQEWAADMAKAANAPHEPRGANDQQP